MIGAEYLKTRVYENEEYSDFRITSLQMILKTIIGTTFKRANVNGSWWPVVLEK